MRNLRHFLFSSLLSLSLFSLVFGPMRLNIPSVAAPSELNDLVKGLPARLASSSAFILISGEATYFTLGQSFQITGTGYCLPNSGNGWYPANGETKVSWEVWAKGAAQSRRVVWADCQDHTIASLNCRWLIGSGASDTAKLKFIVSKDTTGTSNYFDLESSITFWDSSWHHGVLTFDGSATPKYHIYIDGVDDASITVVGSGGSVDTIGDGSGRTVYIGRPGDDENKFSGKIASLNAWHTTGVLNQTNVTLLNNNGNGKDPSTLSSPGTTLVRQYRMGNHASDCEACSGGHDLVYDDVGDNDEYLCINSTFEDDYP